MLFVKLNSWHRNHQKFEIYKILCFTKFGYSIFLLDQKQDKLLQTVSSTIYKTLQNAPQKNKCVSQNHFKKSNENFVFKELNHEYFGGSDVINSFFTFRKALSRINLARDSCGEICPELTELKIKIYTRHQLSLLNLSSLFFLH